MIALADFLTRFVQPLVAGGEVRIGAPIPPQLLARWEVELGEVVEAVVAVDQARAAAASGLVVRPPPLALGGEELRLAVALHGALVLAHPGTTGLGVKRGRRELAQHSVELARAGPPDGPSATVGRHTLLGRLFELVRVDTQVKWWTGRAEFRGESPPARLLLWRRVRRVKQETTEVGLSEVLAGDESRPVVGALLEASPLTDLLTLDAPARRWPPFRWAAPQVEVLRYAELARAVAYHWLDELGVVPLPRLRACAAAAGAWEQALATPLEVGPRARPAGAAVEAPVRALPSRGAPALAPADVRAVTAFLVHLNALCAIAEARGDGDLDAPSPLVAASLSARRGPELGQPEATGLRLFFCVPDVAGRCDAQLGAPPGIAGDTRVARRWAAHRSQVRAALGDERLAQLARRLAACL